MKTNENTSEAGTKSGRNVLPSPSAGGGGTPDMASSHDLANGSSKKSTRCFILVIVFFTTILGCAGIMHLERIVDWICGDGDEVKATEAAKAHEILTSVANAAEIFSTRVGGGGDSLFPTNAFQMRDNMSPAVAKSIEGCFSAKAEPLGGYVCHYEVDSARTNFLCKAIPANGYTGCVFVIRKDKAVRQVDDITNVVKAAEAATANGILTSIANAAEIFSIQVGGGGDSLFPTNAFQMRDNMPPAVAKSIEGCFSAKAEPLGGYVCHYEVDSARTNFLCKAIPANGYTGCVFVIRKDKAVREVDEKVNSSTNSVSRSRNQK